MIFPESLLVHTEKLSSFVHSTLYHLVERRVFAPDVEATNNLSCNHALATSLRISHATKRPLSRFQKQLS